MARKSTKRNYNLVKKKVIRLLKASGLYESVDIYLVDRLIENMEIADMSLDDIRERGVVCPISENSNIKQKNHSISSYRDATKSIIELSKKLGMSVRDRAELGLTPEKEDDDDF